jgi:hypothetical protein
MKFLRFSTDGWTALVLSAQPGDRVVVEVDGIGALSNPVEAGW